MKKKWLVAAQNLQNTKALLILELSQYRKCGSMFCFVPMSYFYLETMTDSKIERSDWRGFGRQQLLANSTEI